MTIEKTGLVDKVANLQQQLIAHSKGLDAFREAAKGRRLQGEDKKAISLVFVGSTILNSSR